MIRRQAAANCATLAPACPPRLTKAARQPGSISKPNTSNPRARKRSAIALPIRPRPINPICSRSEASAGGTTDDVCGLEGDKGIPCSLRIAPDCEHTKTADSHVETVRGTPQCDFVSRLLWVCCPSSRRHIQIPGRMPPRERLLTLQVERQPDIFPDAQLRSLRPSDGSLEDELACATFDLEEEVGLRVEPILRLWFALHLQIVRLQARDHDVAMCRVLIVAGDDIGRAVVVLKGREVAVVVRAGLAPAGNISWPR